METFLDTLVTRLAAASLQTLLFAGFVWAICRFVPSLSAATRSWMWWLVAAQMVVGLCLPGSIDLKLLPAAPPTVITSGDASMPAMISITDMAPAPTLAWAWSWSTALLAAWAVLVAAQVVLGIVRWRRIAGVVARAVPHDDVRLETLCAKRARALGLRRSPRLAVSAEVDSPQVVGAWRPTILLPLDDAFGDEEREMALMHELAHVRRGDLLLGGIPALARTLFFFHPAAHVAVREYALCREAACDALAVDRGRLAPGMYGRLLLRLGVAPHPHHALPGASPTFRILKRRLDMLGQSQDARPRAITTLLVASLAVAAALPWRVVAADSQVNTPYFAQATDEQETPATSPAANPAPAANPSPAAKAAPARIVDKRSAEYRTMYDMPTPPTPATPATPAAPAAPMSRMAPPPPPPAPAAPAAPKAPKASSSSFSYSTIDDHGATRHHQSINDSHGYITVANEDGVWELRDPAYLTRIRAIYNNAFKDGPAGPAPAMDPKRAAELAQREAMLSEQMAKLAERQAQMSIAEANPGHAQRDPAAYAEGRAAIGREQADVGRQMGEVARERAMQGRTEAEWNRAIADRSQKANDEVKAVLDDARRNHALVRAD